ncbi:MAG: class I SAM-dependent methyltransferase [Clostridiales bacterium]|nr:class I SAM-dependent methyltransferase [Clostridiales bacterium]
MKRYVGLLSEVNDLRQKNQTDVDAYIKIAKRYEGKILELGSGSGNISIELAKEGYEVTCLEIHRDMIHLHEEKLNESIADNTTLVLGDMCSFDLEEKFDLIIAANNLVNSVKTTEDMRLMLSSVKKHLSSAGVFVIECDYPNIEEMKAKHDIEVKTYFENPRSQMNVENKVTPKYNFNNLTRQDRIVITEFKNDRIKRRIQVIKDFKIWLPEELQQLFKDEKMHIMLESGNIHNIEPINKNSKHMVFFLKI